MYYLANPDNGKKVRGLGAFRNGTAGKRALASAMVLPQGLIRRVSNRLPTRKERGRERGFKANPCRHLLRIKMLVQSIGRAPHTVGCHDGLCLAVCMLCVAAVCCVHADTGMSIADVCTFCVSLRVCAGCGPGRRAVRGGRWARGGARRAPLRAVRQAGRPHRHRQRAAVQQGGVCGVRGEGGDECGWPGSRERDRQGCWWRRELAANVVSTWQTACSRTASSGPS